MDPCVVARGLGGLYRVWGHRVDRQCRGGAAAEAHVRVSFRELGWQCAGGQLGRVPLSLRSELRETTTPGPAWPRRAMATGARRRTRSFPSSPAP